jgi:hypothetical protein
MKTAQPAGGTVIGITAGSAGGRLSLLSPAVTARISSMREVKAMPINKDDLPKVAMSVAREVFGWEDAVFSDAQPNRMIWKKLPRPEDQKDLFGFDFEQIDDVFKILRSWCEEHEGFGFTLHFTRRGHYVVTVEDESVRPPMIFVETDDFENASHGMLSACLEADRKLRGAA